MIRSSVLRFHKATGYGVNLGVGNVEMSLDGGDCHHKVTKTIGRNL